MGARCTVIVLNYNGEQLLPACLDSLARQTGMPAETIVVDNASTDGSATLVSENYPWARFLALDQNYGFSAANNVALREALASGSEYALLLNNDTYVAADCVSQMVAVMQTDPRIAAVCPKIYFAENPNVLWYAGANFNIWTGRVATRGWKQFDDGTFDDATEISQATGCAMLLRCAALRDVGLFDEKFWAYVEDLDLSVRLRRKGYRLSYAPSARVWHWDGATVKSLGSGSQEFRQYLSTRNLLFLARKHIRWWQIPTFFAGFLLTHVVFYSAVRLWRRDFRAFLAIYKGISHGLQPSLHGGMQFAVRKP
ncbi:MAG: glycosyltransferase family 2 protein [Acidobacteriota bacterium]|nr:glycosyltransferase family 2 protein [Acidobacteriota bacterium]